MLLIATILHFLSSTSAKHKRTVFRERTLRQTSVTLMRALDKESIYAAVLDGVQKLAKDMPGTRAAIATGPAEAMTISAALGDHATEVEGIEVNLQNLPDPICAHLVTIQPGVAEDKASRIAEVAGHGI
jgi:hypothetical protein